MHDFCSIMLLRIYCFCLMLWASLLGTTDKVDNHQTNHFLKQKNPSIIIPSLSLPVPSLHTYPHLSTSPPPATLNNSPPSPPFPPPQTNPPPPPLTTPPSLLSPTSKPLYSPLPVPNHPPTTTSKPQHPLMHQPHPQNLRLLIQTQDKSLQGSLLLSK